MRIVYIALIVVSLAVISMLVLTFFYLDQQRHQSFLYALYYENEPAGWEKVDRYVLEDKVIYKSFTELPRNMLREKIDRKITFDARGKNFLDYTKNTLSNGAKGLYYIVNSPEKTSFMASAHADFACLEPVPRYGNDVLFEAVCAASYQSVMRRYNFKKRGKQFVNALSPVFPLLPPAREIISVTSMGKDVIEIENKKTGCERFLLELKSGDSIYVWATKTFHNILMLEIPGLGFRAVLCHKRGEVPVAEYGRKSGLYTEKDVSFVNEEIELRGSLAVPVSGEEGPLPAVMLIWDSGPLDRDGAGIFTDIAHALAEAGYCVLRFDKRGTGKSKGFLSAYAQPEEISDLRCALNFLKERAEVDKSRIALLGHAEGGFYAAHLAAADKEIKACVILSAASSLSPLKNNCEGLKNIIKKEMPRKSEYQESAIATLKQSREMIKGKSDWITILDKRVFIKKVALEDKYNPVETVKALKIPTLILQGRRDIVNSGEEAQALGDALARAGNENFTIIYFGELGHNFGKLVKDPPVREHIEVDDEALKSIIGWLDKNLLPLPVETIPLPDDELEGAEAGELPEAIAEKAVKENEAPVAPQAR